jgi:hypothetical protein
MATDAATAEAGGEALRAERQETIWRENCENHDSTVERLRVRLKHLLLPPHKIFYDFDET